MKITSLFFLLVLVAGCGQREVQPITLSLSYQQPAIQNQFDTLYNNQQTASGFYKGFIEQALAVCISDPPGKDTVTQDVFSSMYLNLNSGKYDCVTTTVFNFPDGTIAAMGLFHLIPGDTIAPDHDFPITGGSGVYSNIHGRYTRQYRNGTYHVSLNYKTRD